MVYMNIILPLLISGLESSSENDFLFTWNAFTFNKPYEVKIQISSARASKQVLGVR